MFVQLIMQKDLGQPCTQLKPPFKVILPSGSSSEKSQSSTTGEFPENSKKIVFARQCCQRGT